MRKPPPTPTFQPKVIRDSSPDCRINSHPDTDVCRSTPEMLWMDYLVGVSHFAKYGTNRPLIVCKNDNNFLKNPLLSYEEHEKVIRNPHAVPNHHQKLTTSRGSSLVRVRTTRCSVYLAAKSVVAMTTVNVVGQLIGRRLLHW